MSDRQNFEDELFELAMQKEWEEVVYKFKITREAHTMKLPESEDTAFHVAISCYNSKLSPNTSHERSTMEMIDVMKDRNSLKEVLRMRNANGDTPLHLAAAVGWEVICDKITSEERKQKEEKVREEEEEVEKEEEEEEEELIAIRNEKGETPLFIAAHHGNLDAFLKLHDICVGENQNLDASLFRRKDGNTVLHSAISGEYLNLAYFIIKHYKNLVHSVNVDGETPLHVLARKPNVFRSSCNLGLYESIIYQFLLVDYLGQPLQRKHDSRPYNFPENYRTCVNFFLLWRPIYGIFAFIAVKRRRNPLPDEENQQYVEFADPISENFSASVRGLSASVNSPSKYNGSVPPNWTTCVAIFRIPIKFVQAILEIAFPKIRKTRYKKVKHCHALEILNALFESYSSYRYVGNGLRPLQVFKPRRLVDIPDSPPLVEDEEIHRNPSGQEKEMIQLTSTETPAVAATKMGITELVGKIIRAAPLAIYEQDSEGKNVLMLAAEDRNMHVLNYLENYSSTISDQALLHVDNEGNNILHLAAKLGLKQPWQIPGDAFQMQCEIKWYKHVKGLVPSSCRQVRNAKGETPKQIFTRTHENLLKSGNQWLIKTSESCSVVAALIATVAFATSATVPGGSNQENGYPVLRNRRGFHIFAIASLLALCLSITALVFFIAIITSRFEERNFKRDLPRKILMGLSCLFCSITAMLLSFCAGHTFILTENLRVAAVPIYAATALPVTLFAVAQLPLYFSFVWAAYTKVPLRRYKE